MRLQGNLAADESDRSEESGGDEFVPDDRERCCDVTQVERGPPFLRAVVGCPADDTVPAEEYNLLSTTETGDTVESSAFLELNKKQREECTFFGGLFLSKVRQFLPSLRP